jgi:hypothetical protein
LWMVFGMLTQQHVYMIFIWTEYRFLIS